MLQKAWKSTRDPSSPTVNPMVFARIMSHILHTAPSTSKTGTNRFKSLFFCSPQIPKANNKKETPHPNKSKKNVCIIRTGQEWGEQEVGAEKYRVRTNNAGRTTPTQTISGKINATIIQPQATICNDVSCHTATNVKTAARFRILRRAPPRGM